MMSLWDALRMNMMISYQELVRTFLSFAIVYWLLGKKVKPLTIIGGIALVGIFGSWIGLF